MFDDEKLKQLESAQDLLVVQAEAHRRLIQMEWSSLRDEMPWFRVFTGPGAAGGGGGLRWPVTGWSPWGMAGAALAGLVAVRKWRTLVRWAPALVSAWRWYRRIFPR